MIKALALSILFIPLLSFSDCLQGRNGQVSCGAGECQIDSAGKVSCSQFVRGGAALTRTGRVQCGVGQCLQGSTGQVICSSVEDGGAALNQAGQVKCFGACEQGSEAMCESIEGL